MSADFNTDLEFSKTDAFPWEEIYRKHFHDFDHMIDKHEFGEHQFKGIDRIVVLKGGKEVLIDEKLRRKDYGDIALEVGSSYGGAKSWLTKPMEIDYYAYGILPSRKAYMLPAAMLRSAWHKYGDTWKHEHGTNESNNGSYLTTICPVPVEIVFRAMGEFLTTTAT